MALTDRERRLIRDERDQGQPQLPLYDETVGWALLGYCADPTQCQNLEVNHIINQSDGGADDPLNLITIPKCIHVGVCPDRKILYRYALTNKESFLEEHE